ILGSCESVFSRASGLQKVARRANVWKKSNNVRALKERQKYLPASSTRKIICASFQTLHVWLPSRLRLRRKY
ncbi:MAG TPA: hypothetical protein VKB86_10495, partial [Pyrinomonadaceae bacterium]|nr:hypothetical protein [Pyrinomonadaceae bacterium]